MPDDTGDREPGFFDVVLRQRATREFSDDAVGDELVERCLLAATHAPSAENLQPWVFVVVRDADQRARIADVTRRVWRAGGRQQSVGRLPDQLLAEVDRGAERGIGSAPVIVVVCGDSAVAHESTLASSIYPAVQNLLLAAAALGLGSAMTTLATHAPGELAAILELPEKVRPMAVVPLGHPKRPPGPPRRHPVSDRAHRDRYGTRW
jgi:nitroreductase